jgi:hypothetical protein
MGEKYQPVKGDRVRVVLEGEVGYVGDLFFDVQGKGALNSISPDGDHVVSIEKLEPPVEVFGPGDVVRHQRIPGLVYALGASGYFAVEAQAWRPGDYGKAFTSDRYEKVDLG